MSVSVQSGQSVIAVYTIHECSKQENLLFINKQIAHTHYFCLLVSINVTFFFQKNGFVVVNNGTL
jgi:hypothetical protein